MSQISPLIETRNLEAIGEDFRNVYEAIVAITKRSNQISTELKQELHGKLEDFASHNDSLEEIQENREQIEISRFYEKLPHPVLLAINEFEADQLNIRRNDEVIR